MIAVAIEMIELDSRGVAYIAGTRMKVKQVVGERKYNGLTAEEIIEAYPHLSLAAVHAALSYYYSHSEELDRQIAEDEATVERIKKTHPNRFTREELERSCELQNRDV